MKWIDVAAELPPKTRDEVLFAVKCTCSDQGFGVCVYIVFAQYDTHDDHWYWAYNPAYTRRGVINPNPMDYEHAIVRSAKHRDLRKIITHWMPLELPKLKNDALE